MNTPINSLESQPKAPVDTARHAAVSGHDLFRQTLRMVAVLVAACVIFVGALSVVAVALTSRAVGGAGAGAAEARTPEATQKKPLSI